MPQRSKYRKCALRECWKPVKPSKYAPFQKFCGPKCRFAEQWKRKKKRLQAAEKAETAAIIAELRQEQYHR